MTHFSGHSSRIDSAVTLHNSESIISKSCAFSEQNCHQKVPPSWMDGSYVRFRTTQGTEFTIANNPATLFSDAADEIQTHPNLPPGEMTFSYGQQKLSLDTSFGSLNIEPDSHILISFGDPNNPRRLPPSREVPAPGTFNIFARSNTYTKQDPTDFEARVQNLLMFGRTGESVNWTRAQCEKALRESFFDMNRAACYLLTMFGAGPGLAQVELPPKAASAAHPPPAAIELVKSQRKLIEELMRETGKGYPLVSQVLAALAGDLPREQWKSSAIEILSQEETDE
jgi:hypothetical protein